MPALRCIARTALFCSLTLAAVLIPCAAQAQLYSWKDPQGNVTIKNVPPPWYRESELSPGPRVQVLRGGKVIDDTTWSLVKRQEQRPQSALQDARRPPGQEQTPAARKVDDD